MGFLLGKTPKSQRTYQALRQRLQDLINRDAEEAQRRQQEDAFAKQLGGGQNGGKGLTGKGDGKTKGKDKDNKDASPTKIDSQVQKLKDQTSLKDAQLSALAGQLKKAGIQPDFKSAREKQGRSETPKGARRLLENLPAAGTSSATIAARKVTMPAIAPSQNGITRHRALQTQNPTLPALRRESRHLASTIVHGKAKNVSKVLTAAFYT